jgi:hypothetical protein
MGICISYGRKKGRDSIVEFLISDARIVRFNDLKRVQQLINYYIKIITPAIFQESSDEILGIRL